MWVPIKPLPDAFIINIGDVLEVANIAFLTFSIFFFLYSHFYLLLVFFGMILQIVTKGIYHSIEHRGTVNTKKQSLLTPETPALSRRIGVAD